MKTFNQELSKLLQAHQIKFALPSFCANQNTNNKVSIGVNIVDKIKELQSMHNIDDSELVDDEQVDVMEEDEDKDKEDEEDAEEEEGGGSEDEQDLSGEEEEDEFDNDDDEDDDL